MVSISFNMSYNKIWLIMLMLSLTSLLIGCTNNSSKLTTSMIVSALEHHNITLIAETDPNSPSIFAKTYNNVSPDRYQIDEHQTISIFIYSSQKEAKKGLKQFQDNTVAASVVPHKIFQFNNSLVFYIGNDSEHEKKIGQAMDSFLKNE